MNAMHRFKQLTKVWQLYVMLLPLMAYFIIFKYGPMYGLQIALRDYFPSDGIWGSPWVGLNHFYQFFDSFYFWRLIRNTIGMSLYNLAVFPVSIIVALAFNELRDGPFKRTAQTITYAPHFISLTVMVGIIFIFLDPEIGLINYIIQAFGFNPASFMEPSWFKTIFVWSGSGSSWVGVRLSSWPHYPV